VHFRFQKSQYRDLQIAKRAGRFRKIGLQGFAQAIVAKIFVA
jgi:hypothetical protein